jgi:glycosyltransferase involved in cell wall biosynthesis
MGHNDFGMTSPTEEIAKPLRVLYVDSSLGFGGAVISLSILLNSLPGVQKFILTSQDQAIIDSWFAAARISSFRRAVNYRNKDRILARIRRPTLRRLASRGLAIADAIETFRNTPRVVRLLRKHRIDLMHLNNGFLPPEALLASRFTGVPCIVHLRDFQHEEIGRKRSAGVAAVVAISDAVADSLPGKLGRAVTITTVHNPVDLARAQQACGSRDRIRHELGLSASDIAVGIFGRVIPWKGQLEFVQAMIPAVQENPALRPIIVGDEADGNRSYFENIKLIIRNAGLQNAFVLAGYRSNVEEFYAAVDIVVHASITPEPFGRVVVEAMAARRPVIAANAGGPPEIIDHGVDGILFPPGDVAALSKAVSMLAADTDLRKRMGAAAATKAERFGIDAYSERIDAIYSAALRHARRPAK